MKYFSLKSLNYLFILFILFLFLEAIYSFYYYKISFYIEFIEFKYSSTNSTFIWNENGLVENIQIFFLLITILNFIVFIKKKIGYDTSKLFKYFIFLYFTGLLFFFFEEISWGQHFFNWSSPIFFINLNHQGETNLHNISNLFNEIPRSLLLIWCSLSFIFVKKFYDYKNFNSFIFPDENLKKISYLIILVVLPDLFLKKFGLYIDPPPQCISPCFDPDGRTENCVSPCYSFIFPVEYIETFEIISLTTFNFLKLSEFQELLFTYYILVHSFYIKKLKVIRNSY